MENWDTVSTNLKALELKKINIEFNGIKRFDNGKGLLIPSNKNTISFDILRQKILSSFTSKVRKQYAHITLMHPHNSTCTDEIFEQVLKIQFPKLITFDIINYIEQIDGGRWRTIEEFPI